MITNRYIMINDRHEGQLMPSGKVLVQRAWAAAAVGAGLAEPSNRHDGAVPVPMWYAKAVCDYYDRRSKNPGNFYDEFQPVLAERGADALEAEWRLSGEVLP